MGQAAVGTKCRFCGEIVRVMVPAESTKAFAAERLDEMLTSHLQAHVEDFLYGEGGVFSGSVRR